MAYCAQGDKNARPKLESVEAPPSTETAIDEQQEGILESQMRSLDDMVSDDNMTGGGGGAASVVSNPALRSYVGTGNPLAAGSHLPPSTPTTSFSGAPPLLTAISTNSRGENSVGTNYVHIIPSESVENDATAAAAVAAAAFAAADPSLRAASPWGSPSLSASKYADRPLAPRKPNNGYSMPTQPLASARDTSSTYSGANFATSSTNNGSNIPSMSSRNRLRSDNSNERESVYSTVLCMHYY